MNKIYADDYLSSVVFIIIDSEYIFSIIFTQSCSLKVFNLLDLCILFFLFFCFSGRKMNTQLENAIQEAMLELDRQSSELLTDETEEESFISSNISLSDTSISPMNVRTNKTRVYRRR